MSDEYFEDSDNSNKSPSNHKKNAPIDDRQTIDVTSNLQGASSVGGTTNFNAFAPKFASTTPGHSKVNPFSGVGGLNKKKQLKADIMNQGLPGLP